MASPRLDADDDASSDGTTGALDDFVVVGGGEGGRAAVLVSSMLGLSVEGSGSASAGGGGEPFVALDEPLAVAAARGRLRELDAAAGMAGGAPRGGTGAAERERAAALAAIAAHEREAERSPWTAERLHCDARTHGGGKLGGKPVSGRARALRGAARAVSGARRCG